MVPEHVTICKPLSSLTKSLISFLLSKELISSYVFVVDDKEVRPVVMSILKNMSYIEDRYRHLLSTLEV